jgi:hypothetical protein
VVFRFDRADLNFGFAAAASVVIAVLLGVVYSWGAGTGSGAFGFVLTGLAFSATPSLSWIRAVSFGLVGGLLTLLAFVVSGHPGWSAVVLGVVAGIAAFATMRRSGDSANWSLLAVWTLVALLIVEEGAELEAAIAFVVGSAIAGGLAALLRRDTDMSIPWLRRSQISSSSDSLNLRTNTSSTVRTNSRRGSDASTC